MQVPTLIGTYMIKAVNGFGTKSLEATSIFTNIGSIAGLNTVETISEHNTSPSFAGVKTNVEVDGAALRLKEITGGVEPEGLYEFDNEIDLFDIYTSRITPIIDVVGENINEVMSLWTSLSAVTALDTASQSTWSIELEMRTSQDDSPPVWSSWFSVQAGGDVTFRRAQFRLWLYGMKEDDDDLFATVTPSITTLTVQIDMPDRVTGGDDITTTGGRPGLIRSPMTSRSGLRRRWESRRRTWRPATGGRSPTSRQPDSRSGSSIAAGPGIDRRSITSRADMDG